VEEEKGDEEKKDEEKPVEQTGAQTPHPPHLLPRVKL